MRRILGLTLVLLLAGCTYTGYLANSFSDRALTPQRFTFEDGGTALFYTFGVGNPGPPDAVAFFISGSGCGSLKYRFPFYFDPAPDLRLRIFALQKRGIDERTTGLVGCPDGFEKTDYFQQTLVDQNAFITAVLSSMPDRPRKVLVFGVSEGGVIASHLSATNRAVTHVALIGSGGMTLGSNLETLRGRLAYLNDLPETRRKISADPGSTAKTAYGQTYKYWSSFLDIAPSAPLLEANIPILLGIGEKDESVPVESAILLKQEFDAAKKDNLALRIYTGANHRLEAPDHSYVPDFLDDMRRLITQHSSRE